MSFNLLILVCKGFKKGDMSYVKRAKSYQTVIEKNLNG